MLPVDPSPDRVGLRRRPGDPSDRVGPLDRYCRFSVGNRSAVLRGNSWSPCCSAPLPSRASWPILRSAGPAFGLRRQSGVCEQRAAMCPGSPHRKHLRSLWLCDCPHCDAMWPLSPHRKHVISRRRCTSPVARPWTSGCGWVGCRRPPWSVPPPCRALIWVSLSTSWMRSIRDQWSWERTAVRIVSDGRFCWS